MRLSFYVVSCNLDRTIMYLQQQAQRRKKRRQNDTKNGRKNIKDKIDQGKKVRKPVLVTWGRPMFMHVRSRILTLIERMALEENSHREDGAEAIFCLFFHECYTIPRGYDTYFLLVKRWKRRCCPRHPKTERRCYPKSILIWKEILSYKHPKLKYASPVLKAKNQKNTKTNQHKKTNRTRLILPFSP